MKQRVAEVTADQVPEGKISYAKMRSQVEDVEREAARQGRARIKQDITATHKISGLRGLFRVVTGQPTTEIRRHDNIADLQNTYNEVVDARVQVTAANGNDNGNTQIHEEIGYVGVHEEKRRLRSVVNVKDEPKGPSMLFLILVEISNAFRRAFFKKASRKNAPQKTLEEAHPSPTYNRVYNEIETPDQADQVWDDSLSDHFTAPANDLTDNHSEPVPQNRKVRAPRSPEYVD